jgi:hypothetical protein
MPQCPPDLLDMVDDRDAQLRQLLIRQQPAQRPEMGIQPRVQLASPPQTTLSSTCHQTLQFEKPAKRKRPLTRNHQVHAAAEKIRLSLIQLTHLPTTAPASSNLTARPF